jgi:hypothetical protein
MSVTPLIDLSSGKANIKFKRGKRLSLTLTYKSIDITNYTFRAGIKSRGLVVLDFETSVISTNKLNIVMTKDQSDALDIKTYEWFVLRTNADYNNIDTWGEFEVI